VYLDGNIIAEGILFLVIICDSKWLEGANIKK